MGGYWLQLARWLEQSGASTVFGFVASIIAIVGVPLSYLRARQARTAAEAARVAAEAVGDRMRAVDAVRSLAATLEQLREFIEHLGVENQRSLRRSGHALRRELVEIAELDELLSADDRSKVKATLATLRDVESELGSDSEMGQSLALLRKALVEGHDELHAILARLKARAARRNDAERES